MPSCQQNKLKRARQSLVISIMDPCAPGSSTAQAVDGSKALMLTAETDFVMNSPSYSPSLSRSPPSASIASPDASPSGTIPSYPLASTLAPAELPLSDSPPAESHFELHKPANIVAGKSHFIRIIPPRGLESGLASMEDANELPCVISPTVRGKASFRELDVFEYGVKHKVRGNSTKVREGTDILAESLPELPRKRSRPVREASTRKRTQKQERKRRSARLLSDTSELSSDAKGDSRSTYHGTEEVSLGSPTCRMSPRRSPQRQDQGQVVTPSSGLNTIRIRLRTLASVMEDPLAVGETSTALQTQAVPSQTDDLGITKKQKKRVLKETSPKAVEESIAPLASSKKERKPRKKTVLDVSEEVKPPPRYIP